MFSKIIRAGKTELFRFLNTKNEKSVIVPPEIEQLSNMTFSNKDAKGVELVYLHDGITEIPDHCFEGSTVRAVRLSPKTTRIGDAAFKNCANLSYIRVPEGCGLGTKTWNGSWAGSATVFENCPKMRQKWTPWIQYVKEADGRFVILWEGGFLQRSTDRQNCTNVTEDESGYCVAIPKKDPVYYRVAIKNETPTYRLPGEWRPVTGMIQVKA